MQQQPFIAADTKLPELTLRVIIISIFLTIILAMSNAYLALKIGILTSASIPAAMISMGILRFFKNASILENNLVQTAASAGEAVAGGIVYTIPALVIIGFWFHFNYLENFLIAFLGGTLGVLFSIPLRRVLVTDPDLRFPEGMAIAQVLKSSSLKLVRLRDIVLAGFVGAGLESLQTGFKLIANSWQVWFVAKRLLFGFGAGFSPAMIGAGYLIGFELTFSILIGAVIAWLIGVPLLSEFTPHLAHATSPTVMVMTLWSSKIRYMGIGAMLFAGVWTFLTLLKPFYNSLKVGLQAMSQLPDIVKSRLPRTERDMPLQYVLFGIILVALLLYLFFLNLLPMEKINTWQNWLPSISFLGLMYVLVFGFIFCAITGYFSGMVGVSASPGSSIIIAGILLLAIVIQSIMRAQHILMDEATIKAAEATVIIIASVITGAAAIANDNIQDLKVGHILGATPWRQQIMLLFGVLVAALVIPPIMQLLFNVYGIAGVMPHAGMNPAQTLPAPPAALMAAITQAVFNHHLPWHMMLLGGAITLLMIVVRPLVARMGLQLSVLGVAIGIYLPLASSTPLFIGGFIAYLTKTRLLRRVPTITDEEWERRQQRGILIACGLVAGAALMDVVLAIPFSIMHDPNALSLAGHSWYRMAHVLGVLSSVGLLIWFYRVVVQSKN